MQRMILEQTDQADPPESPIPIQVLLDQIAKAEKEASASQLRNPVPLKRRPIELADAD